MQFRVGDKFFELGSNPEPGKLEFKFDGGEIVYVRFFDRYDRLKWQVNNNGTQQGEMPVGFYVD